MGRAFLSSLPCLTPRERARAHAAFPLCGSSGVFQALLPCPFLPLSCWPRADETRAPKRPFPLPVPSLFSKAMGRTDPAPNSRQEQPGISGLDKEFLPVPEAPLALNPGLETLRDLLFQFDPRVVRDLFSLGFFFLSFCLSIYFILSFFFFSSHFFPIFFLFFFVFPFYFF